MNRFLRLCRTLHSWLGVLIVPWVIAIGFTGFYLNHADLVLGMMGETRFSEARFIEQKAASPVTRETAVRLVQKHWPGTPVKHVREDSYHNWPSYIAETDKGELIVAKESSHYYVKSDFTRETYSPSGELLHTKRYWGWVFEELHETGWLGGGMGTWFADIVALAMIFFGLTGLVLWLTPRVRRLKKRLRSRMDRGARPTAAPAVAGALKN